MKVFGLILIAALLMGCGNDVPGLQVDAREEINGYIAEATAIQESAQANSQRVQATVAALEAEVAHKAAVNVSLYATLQAVNPSIIRAAVNAGGAPTPQAILEGRRWFIKTGMASHVSDANGCSDAPETNFTPSSSVIYATFKAFNIDAGTPLSARWTHEGQTMHEESFDLANSSSEICLWFSIEPGTVEFVPGMWTVQLYAEQFPLESPMAFNILAS